MARKVIILLRLSSQFCKEISTGMSLTVFLAVYVSAQQRFAHGIDDGIESASDDRSSRSFKRSGCLLSNAVQWKPLTAEPEFRYD